MAINYPGSLDDFTNPAAGNTLDSPSHSGQHSDLNDAVEALEAKVGIGASPAGSATAGYVLVAGTADTTWSQVGYEGITSGTATAGQVLTAQGGGTAIWETPDAGSLVHINTTSFSAVSSVDVNDVFSSTYDNYKIVFSAKLNTTEASVAIRMKTGSVDSGGNYYYAIVSLGANGTGYNQVGAAATSGYFGRVGNGIEGGYAIDIFNPNRAVATTYAGHGVANGPTTTFTERAGGNIFTTTQYTGIQFLALANNFTGSVSIYGYKKA